MRGMRKLYRRLLSSLRVAIGDVTFGMEDGAVSVSGLVFGVAASTKDSKIVVLAGATGAVAGAVSMMAGRYLDVQSVVHRADSERRGGRTAAQPRRTCRSRCRL
jgi:hypothetical protein